MTRRFVRIVTVIGLGCLILLSTSFTLQAGKILKVVKWAAWETVKTALIESVEHEGNQTFEAFTKEFCQDSAYRKQVVSLPVINQLVGDQGKAEQLISEELGCAYTPGMINVVFTGAVPGNYQMGHATTCVLKANIRNYSKYHLNDLSIQVGSWRFDVGEMVANASRDDVPVGTISLTGDVTCSGQANYLLNSMKDAGALVCSMPGVAEGDCQELVWVSTTLDDDAVKRLADLEDRTGKEVEKEAEKKRKSDLVLELAETFTPDLPLPEPERVTLTKPIGIFTTLDRRDWVIVEGTITVLGRKWIDDGPGHQGYVCVVRGTRDGREFPGIVLFRDLNAAVNAPHSKICYVPEGERSEH